MKRTTRGSSFIEVLLAMTIMALVLVGILQMFSVSLIINKGSAARTQMLFKCQQVVENVRLFYHLTRQGSTTPPAITESGHVGGTAMTIPGALPDVLGDVSKSFLPYNQAESAATWGYWGPAGANVMEQENGPYKISYTIRRDGPPNPCGPSGCQNMWVITVSATPTDVATATRYFGVDLKSGKRVDYVAQFP
ncbi:MAG TPA: hypothetical protein VGM13_09150 [Thermoanaerobaculia bacterium]|jgi:hypothetical protein